MIEDENLPWHWCVSWHLVSIVRPWDTLTWFRILKSKWPSAYVSQLKNGKRINIPGPNADAWIGACGGRNDAYGDDRVGFQAWDGLPRLEGCKVPEDGTLGGAAWKDGRGGFHASGWRPRLEECIMPALGRGGLHASNGLLWHGGCIGSDGDTLGIALCKDEMEKNCNQWKQHIYCLN